MDFLLFYSKYSKHCGQLLSEVPLLNEKTVCIDSKECRSVLNDLPYKIKRVPTLVIVDGVDKILKVIEGASEIKNWFILTTYSMSSASVPIEPSFDQEQVEEIDELMPPQTMLDDINVNEGDEYILKTDKAVGVKSLAEELQRERENFIEKSEPPAKSGR